MGFNHQLFFFAFFLACRAHVGVFVFICIGLSLNREWIYHFVCVCMSVRMCFLPVSSCLCSGSLRVYIPHDQKVCWGFFLSFFAKNSTRLFHKVKELGSIESKCLIQYINRMRIKYIFHRSTKSAVRTTDKQNAQQSMDCHTFLRSAKALRDW